MISETGQDQKQPVEDGVDAGTQMRRAREASGLSLADVASRTRVPLRHLEALERGDYGALPGITYCAGFSRAYARAVGLDEQALTAKVRQEADATGDFGDPYQMDEPVDPARVPPRVLAWTAAVIAILLISGYGIWRMQMNAPPVEAEVIAPVQQAQTRRAAAPAAVTGPVVLTAVEDVWLRIYEPEGKALLERTLAKGESYTLPADAKNPMILTGRADMVAITVGGRPIPPLGTAERTISDVPISAGALLARLDGAGATNAAAAPATAPAPAAGQVAAPPATGTPSRPAQQPARPAPQSRSVEAPENRAARRGPAQPATAPSAPTAVTQTPAPEAPASSN